MKNRAHEEYWPPLLAKELIYPKIPLFKTVAVNAELYPDIAAINYYGKTISYKELYASIESFAGALIKRGVKTGERVAIYMQNSPQFIIAFFGAIRANAAVIPVNPIWQSDELLFTLKDCDATAVICLGDVLPVVDKIKDQINLKAVIVSNYTDYLPEEPDLEVPDNIKKVYDTMGYERLLDVLAEKEAPPEVEIKPDDLCMLPYTSGTTGIPKGCIHTSETILPNTLGVAYWLRMTPGSVHLSSLPYFHVTGLVISVLSPLFSGGTLVVLTRWDKNVAMEAIEKMKCNYWAAITAMVVDFLTIPDLENRDFSSMRGVVGGGAPMPEAVGQRFKDVTGLDFIEGYGLTETSAATHINPHQRTKFQCAGIPDYGIDARIIDPETKKELTGNEQGEIVLSGPEVFKGYWNRPEENAECFIELDGKSFFRTGDLAYMDNDGYFFIVDRTKRMINAAGFKVWPAEVENFLYRHPAVLEACVIGVPDLKRGENVRAYIVLKQGSGNVTTEEVIEWSKGQMAAYKYPREVIFVDILPKSATGKILWKEVQEQALQEININ